MLTPRVLPTPHTIALTNGSSPIPPPIYAPSLPNFSVHSAHLSTSSCATDGFAFSNTAYKSSTNTSGSLSMRLGTSRQDIAVAPSSSGGHGVRYFLLSTSICEVGFVSLVGWGGRVRGEGRGECCRQTHLFIMRSSLNLPNRHHQRLLHNARQITP